MIPGRIQIRRYESQVKTLFDYLKTLPPGSARTAELSHWSNTDIHVVVLSPGNITQYTALLNDAALLGIHIYPAFRTQPLSCASQPAFKFSSYVDTTLNPTFWEHNATRLNNVAALRLPGDPWVGLDMENYAAVTDECQQLNPAPLKRDGLEPSAANLEANGFTVNQLRMAMKPFINALDQTNASVALYPAIPNGGEDLLYIAEILGRDRVELWTESTFNNSEHYRKSARLGWQADAAIFLKLVGQFQTKFPGYLIRPGINDLERAWADPYRRDPLLSGTAAAWGFDFTRNDSSQFGTAEYRKGTSLSKLNDVYHVWPLHPMGKTGSAEFDTGKATPTALSAVEGKPDSLVLRRGDSPIQLNPDGLQFVPPKLPNTWAGLRGVDVLPAHPTQPDVSGSFTIDGTIRLPTCPATLDSCPIFGAVSYNIGPWQVAYDGTLDKIALYVRWPSAPAGQPRYRVLDMMQAPPRGEDIRFQVGRAGNNWLHQATLSWPVGPLEVGRTTLDFEPGVYRSLLIGAGMKFSTFPRAKSLVMSPGIVFLKTWSIYDWLLTIEELEELREEKWRKLPDRRAGSWPYGYGKPH